MSTFEREDRYIVIKREDLRNLDPEVTDINAILRHQEGARKMDGKPPLECVVVESTWPEYEIVWRMLKDRTTGEKK